MKEKILTPRINKPPLFSFVGKYFRYLGISLSILCGLQILPTATAQEISCEWGKVKKILMHQPGSEVEIGVYHPKAALFEKFFNVSQSIREHQQYIDLLKGEGASVFTIVGVLLEGTQDANGEALKNLREFAARSLSYEYDETFSDEEIEEQEKYRVSTVMQMPPHQLVDVIMNRPTIRLKKTNKNTFLQASYSLSPVMNMYFLRDQMITTSKGVVLGRMNSSQRFPEVEIVKFVLNKMGIEPTYQVEGEGRLEGGDFFPAGKVAFIGQGLRTNSEAIRQLIREDVFGSIETLVVVKDPYKDQDQMHLDTYFNIINPNTAVMIETRIHEKGVEPEIPTVVDIYSRSARGEYTVREQDVDFVDYLREALNFDLIPVTSEDQLKYGVNFLTIKSNRLLGIDGVSQTYKDVLKSHGVDVTWMDFSALTSGYGAAHCMTQVLERGGP